MGTKSQKRPIAAIMGMLMAFAFMAVFALPQQAMANDLKTISLSTQASPDRNTTLPTAKELKFGESYVGTFDYAEGSTDFESYWFKFKTSNRNSVYAVQLDSINGKEIYMYFNDQDGDWMRGRTWTNYGWTSGDGGRASTNSRVTCTKDDADKNAWYYIHINHNDASRYHQYRLTVYEKKTLSSENVSVSQESFVYDGTAHTPAVTVTYDGAKLVKDVDYVLEYKNNINAGSGNVVVTGMGDNYTGEVAKTFTIEPITAKPTISMSRKSYVYDGYEHKPDIVVKAGSEVLDEDQYTVTYPDYPEYVGTYRVTVTCDGNYKGTAMANYTIKPAGTTLTGVSKGRKSFTANWSSQTSETTGYQLQYSTSSSFKSGSKIKTVTSNYTTSKTVKKLKGKKKYYVRVRTYKNVDGKKYYSAWSGKRSVKTK